MVLLLLAFGIIISVVICILRFLYERSQYHQSSYFQETQTPYSSFLFDKGARGEYNVATRLAPLQSESARILYNLYIPTRNGQTTEIDTVVITHSGIFVIEVKNRSGWIFGNADQKYWCQTLPSSRGSEKHSFYNPIWQNGTHIRALRQLIGQNVPYYSIVVFSDRCTLKKITLGDARAYVVYARELYPLIQRILAIEKICLNNTDIFKIYTKLYPFAHADLETKNKHLHQVSQHHH